MLKKIKLLLSTVKYLKLIQLKYQLLYRIKRTKRFNFYKCNFDHSKIYNLRFDKQVPVYKSYFGGNRFSFLNIDFEFGKDINWDEQSFGKLWNYNLQYCNYLLQCDIPIDEKLEILRSLYSALEKDKLILEPYPVSLRSINVIRLACIQGNLDIDLQESLHVEISFLADRLEFHILGNHLLENAFALAMGGAYFRNNKWFEKGVNLILQEIDEQILEDGAHFELSPMYHQIILFRLLEFCDWYGKHEWKDSKSLKFIHQKVGLMVSWISLMTFRNGDIPLFNDSAKGISYSSEWLKGYAEDLRISLISNSLDDSGYRSINKEIYECRVDFAQIGASYQPGHSHADALSFILYYKGNPLFVEQGTSTYQIGARRSLERSTQAHNTVVVSSQDQSQVWGGFRLANRAFVDILRDRDGQYQATHNGYYRDFGVLHTRTLHFHEKKIEILDFLSKKSNGICYFHLYPGISVRMISENSFLIAEKIKLNFKESLKSSIENYEFADSYNKYQSAERITVSFDKELSTIILFED